MTASMFLEKLSCINSNLSVKFQKPQALILKEHECFTFFTGLFKIGKLSQYILFLDESKLVQLFMLIVEVE
jgi:hypothetical protein